MLPDGAHLGAARRLGAAPRGARSTSVENAIADRLASNFAVRPSVFVSVTAVIETRPDLPDLRRRPGRRARASVEVEAGTTLLQAIALAGGLDRFAATKRIQLRRTDPSTGQERLYLFNFKAVERGAAIQSMITMREGDVIVVPERRLFE